MRKTARDEILGKLRAAPERDISPRPTVPPLRELSWDRERMIEKFTENLSALTGVVHRVRDYDEALDKLAEIAESEGLTKVIVSEDEIIAPLGLPEWGKKHNIEVLTPKDFRDRDEFKRAVFDKAQAGITGADYAVAETGTLCLIHYSDQPRLVSLAPTMHIAIVPVERLRPVYERATDKIFSGKGAAPSQVTLITGPSMTGDIQGMLFTGMHGPRTVIVILVG